MILGNADCGNPRFVGSFKNLARKLFPRYEFRDLEQGHPILVGQQFPSSKWKRKPRAQAMGNGVRELMVLVPNDDLSKAFQTHSDKTREELFQFTANVYLYTVKENLGRTKGDTYIVRDTGKGKPERSIKVARLIVGDNADPEPGGWQRLATVLKNASLATLSAEPVKPGEGKLKGYKAAHWTGTSKFRLTPAGRQEIVDFVNGGGTLLVDAAGASADFADAAADELAAMFGGEAARKALGQALPAGHALYRLPEMAIEKFGYRNFAKNRVVGRLNAPRVAAVEVAGRPAVFYSRDDLSAGLVAHPVDGVVGYDPDTATAIVRNVLVFAETGGKGFPPKPKPKEEGKKDGESKDKLKDATPATAPQAAPAAAPAAR